MVFGNTSKCLFFEVNIVSFPAVPRKGQAQLRLFHYSPREDQEQEDIGYRYLFYFFHVQYNMKRTHTRKTTEE